MSRLAFLGTPIEAAVCLRALVEEGHEIVMVVTRPDGREGRGHRVKRSPVREVADDLGLRVSERTADAATAGAELGVVVAYGRMIPASVLHQLPFVNVHFSLLPRWRGAAPVEWAILTGDSRTGVSLMALDEGLDTGDVYATRAVEISEDDTAATLRSRLTTVGKEILLEALAGGAGSLGTPRPQEGDSTYAPKITQEMLRLEWSRSAEGLRRVVRVGGAWTVFRGRRLKVHDARVFPLPLGSKGPEGPGRLALVKTPEWLGAAGGEFSSGAATATQGGSPSNNPPAHVVAGCGAGLLELVTIQVEGRKPMSGTQWWSGARPAVSDVLGS